MKDSELRKAVAKASNAFDEDTQQELEAWTTYVLRLVRYSLFVFVGVRLLLRFDTFDGLAMGIGFFLLCHSIRHAGKP